MSLANPFGVEVWWNQEPTQMDSCKTLGVGWVRLATLWRDTETSDGVFSWNAVAYQRAILAIERGIKPLFILTFFPGDPVYNAPTFVNKSNVYQQFKDLAYAVVKQFNCEAIELFNEPLEFGVQNNFGGITASEYVNLLVRAGYEGAKLANPNCIVVVPYGAGYDIDNIAGSWGISILVQYGLLNYCDAISIHPYRWGAAPETLITPIQTLKNYLATTSKPNIPIWATEWGINSNDVGGEQQQADHLVRTLDVLLNAGIAASLYFDTWDEADLAHWLFRDESCSLSVARPAFYAYQNYIAEYISPILKKWIFTKWQDGDTNPQKTLIVQ